MAQYSNARGQTFESYESTKNKASTYIVGRSADQMLTVARSNSRVSADLGNYFSNVLNDLSTIQDATNDSISSHLEAWSLSPDFQNLLRSDKTRASDFNEVFNKSYQFWQNISLARKCGVGCIICIAFVDAFWTAVLGPIAGATFSAISRCCGCGSCGSQVNCGL